MKNKMLGIMILMAICLISVSAVQAGCSEGICCDKDLWAQMGENEAQIFTANNVEYEIEVLVISETSNEAKFKVNGQITEALAEGEEDTLADGSVIEVKKIFSENGVSKVIFCFDYGNLQNSKSMNIAEFSPAPQQKYSPGQEVTFRLKATENFEDGIASYDEGFNIQFYTFDATEFTEDQMFFGAGIPGDYIPVDIVKQYNANFISPYWTSTFNVPQKPGKYYTLFTLYCSRDQSTCGHDNILRGAHSKYLIEYEVAGDAPRQNYACDGETGTLKNGETKVYTVERTEYEIKAEKYQGNFKLNVNGEQTDWLYIGTKQTMADGLKIKVVDMGSDDLTFCMTPGPEPTTPETSQPEEKIDLSNFPELFIKGKSLNGIFVVGDQAPADDVIAAIDISVSFQKYGVSKTGEAMLASEIDHYKRNIISVGRPCDNPVTAQILRMNGISDYDLDCSYGLKPRQAMVYLFDYKGYAHLLVFGYSRLETRQAARELTFKKMKGRKQLLGFNGGSMPQPERAELYCEDSDGGVEPYKEGYVYIPESDDIKKKVDSCYAPEELLEGGLPNKGNIVDSCTANELCYVTETYCSQPKEVQRTVIGVKHIPCPNGCKNGACIKGEKEYMERQPEPPITDAEDRDCPGCKKNGACMQIGIRLLENDEPVYCDIDSAFKPQRENDKACMNNYECLSNTCQDSVCQSMGEQIRGIREELEEQKGILEKIMGFFKSMFSFR